LNVKRRKTTWAPRRGEENAIADFDSVINDKQQPKQAIVKLEKESGIARENRRAGDAAACRKRAFAIIINRDRRPQRLPHRRQFEDGQPGELFIQMNKEGSTIGGLMRHVATLTSISLRTACRSSRLVKKFADQRSSRGFHKNTDSETRPRSPTNLPLDGCQ